MSSRDPRRILRIVRRTTAGSLVAAVAGSGVVAVHLAGDHAAAVAATRAEPAPEPLRGDSGTADRGSAPARTATPSSSPSSTAKATPTRHKHHRTTTSTSSGQGFAPVAPVRPGSGSPQSGSGGS